MLRKIIAISTTAALLAGGLSFAPAALAADPADAIYVNGNIYTVDSKFSVAEALAVKDGKIVYVGTDAGAQAYAATDTEVVDLGGQTVIPGLIESHMHYQSLGSRAEEIDIFNKPKAEILAKVKAEADRLQPGEWIRAGGWNNELWGETYPTKEDLDAVAPNNPVALSRADGHSTWFNSLALSIGGITLSTPNPQGGEILKKEDGSLWGLLTDTAASIVTSKIPSTVSAERTLRRYQLADKQVLSYGITTLVDAGISYDNLKILKDAYSKGLLKVRAYEMLSDGEDVKYIADGQKPVQDLYDGKLSARAVKLYSDGSLGSRSAWLLESYSDRAGYVGERRWTDAELYDTVKRVAGAGFQIGTHAIGDAAVRQVIDQYEKVTNELKLTDHRFRIEHFQIVNAADIPRTVKLGIIPSMEAVHATSDMNMAEDRVGSTRIKSSYAWRTIIDDGGIVANGSDAPVELVNPYDGLYASVTRMDSKGQPAGGWYKELAMTREEALKSFTIWGAYASFSEDTKGSLEVGKYADFVVLDRDYMKIPDSEIFKIQALRTYVGGELVYEAEATAESPATSGDGLSAFSDAGSVASWAAPFFEKLIAAGTISGYKEDNTLRPKNNVTRAEFTKMVVGGLKINAGGAATAFTDVKDGDWYKGDVETAFGNGLIKGLSDTAFAPNATITRQDLATIAYRAIVALKLEIPSPTAGGFSDDAAIGDYAKDAVYVLKELNIISGRDSGAFDPKAFATREETAKIISGVIDYAASKAGA
ncbi:MAG: amidohydrolase family protein [Clostridiales Family XIII bacterium]|nr:amidohydrolase family protein [Clostridiales Family XIII bacterium]